MIDIFTFNDEGRVTVEEAYEDALSIMRQLIPDQSGDRPFVSFLPASGRREWRVGFLCSAQQG
jgi:hypothetical protein